MWNMKILSLVAHKLWPRLKCLSTDDNKYNNNDDNDVGAMANSSPDFRHGELKKVYVNPVR